MLGSEAGRRRTQPLAHNPYKGVTLDAVTELYDDRVPNYSPSLGRWMEQDPAQYNNGASTYQFVGSDPVGNVDAEGLADNPEADFEPELPGFRPFGIESGGGGSGEGPTEAGSGTDTETAEAQASEPAPAAGTASADYPSMGELARNPALARYESVPETPGEPATEYCPASAAEQPPGINPNEVAGKTPAEIDAIAREKGLILKEPDPMNGKGAYVDPVTGQQRILVHPGEEPPAAHVNDPSGGRLDINGNPLQRTSPTAHLPFGGQR